MSVQNCECACPDPTIVEVPGQPGEDGAAGDAGTNGVNAYTNLTSDLLIPAINSNVTASVVNSAWMALGQIVIVSDGTEQGTFEVVAVPNALSVELMFLGYPSDSAPASTILEGTGTGTDGRVSPSGELPVLAAPLPTAVNYTALTTAGAIDNANVAAGVGRCQLFFNHVWLNNVLAVEPVTTFVIPYKFKLISWCFVTTELLVGGGGTRTANMEIGTTDVGGNLTVLIADATVGTVVTAVPLTGGVTGNAGDNISIEIQAGGTAFSAGSGTFVIDIMNLDTADAIASLSDHVNDLITSLT